MRINPDSSSNLIEMLSIAQQQEAVSLRQLSSGRRVEKPSDDPAACAASTVNRQQQAQIDQFTQSVSSVQQLLSTADGALGSVVSALERAVSLGVEGATGTLSAENRASLATEIQGIQDQLLSLANTSFQGVYIFAGTAVLNQPFVVSPSAASGIVYKGNQQSTQVPIGERRTIATGVPGDALFLDPASGVFASLKGLADALINNDATAAETATASVRHALAHVSNVRTNYGNALNQLETQTSLLQDAKLRAQAREDDLIGADEGAAITKLRQAQFARDATLAAAARTQFTSLLDYLQ